jgi:hypothetical protein
LDEEHSDEESSKKVMGDPPDGNGNPAMMPDSNLAGSIEVATTTTSIAVATIRLSIYKQSIPSTNITCTILSNSY